MVFFLIIKLFDRIYLIRKYIQWVHCNIQNLIINMKPLQYIYQGLFAVNVNLSEQITKILLLASISFFFCLSLTIPTTFVTKYYYFILNFLINIT